MVVSALIIFYLLINLYEYFLNTEFTDQSNFLYFGMSSLFYAQKSYTQNSPQSTEVKDLLESLRQSIQITPVIINSNTLIKTSVSIGIASTENLQPLTDKKPYNLVQNFISEADIALYRAKETGRNKVVIAANIQSPLIPAS